MLREIQSEFRDHALQFYNDLIALLPELAIAIIILFLFWLINKLIQRLIRSRLDILVKDPVLIGFIGKVISYTLIIIGISISLKVLGLDAIIIGIFSGAGVLAIVLGFAFKDIGENFIAGMILAFNRPFKQGDLIMLGSDRGRVTKMTIRETQIKTGDGKDIFIPNASILKGNLVNYTIDGFLRYEIEIAVEEGSDLAKCSEIILNTLKNIEGILEIPSPQVLVTTFGSSTFVIQYNFWIDLFDENFPRLQVRSKAHFRVWEALNEAGFSLPGDVMEVKTFNDRDFPVLQKPEPSN